MLCCIAGSSAGSSVFQPVALRSFSIVERSFLTGTAYCYPSGIQDAPWNLRIIRLRGRAARARPDRKRRVRQREEDSRVPRQNE